jgi:hypothetical protein
VSSRVHALGGGAVHTAYAAPRQSAEANADTVSEAPSPRMPREPPHAGVQAPPPLRDTPAVSAAGAKTRPCGSGRSSSKRPKLQPAVQKVTQVGMEGLAWNAAHALEAVSQ